MLLTIIVASIQLIAVSTNAGVNVISNNLIS